MNARAILFCTAMLLTACGSSQNSHSATAITTPQASPSALAAPQRSASNAPTAAAIAPHSGASEAARAAGAEPRGVTTPTTSGVPASGAMAAATVTPTAAVTPPSGASEAAKVAGAEARTVTIPSVRAVPAGGVMAAPSVVSAASGVTSVGDTLPPGVPYASDTDPVRIVSYVLSSTVIHPGDDVTGDVVTSSNVASVTVRVGTFSVAVPKVAQGKFHLEMKMPSMPLPPGPTKLTITAIRTDGKNTSRDVEITVEL